MAPDPHCRIGKVRPRGNVVLFPGVVRHDLTVGRQPDAGTIRMARDLLLRAERGEIQGIAAVIGTSEHETASQWTGFDTISVGRIIGSLHILAHEFSAMTLRQPPISPFPDER